MLRYTVDLEGDGAPIAILEWYVDAKAVAKERSKDFHKAYIGFTPMGKHHRTIETWENGNVSSTTSKQALD